jgi:hypothetical protein
MENLEGRKYCRSCGLDLQTVSQALSGNLIAIRPGEIEGAKPEVSERRKFLRRGFMVVWGGFLIAAFFGIMGSAFSHLDHDLGALIEGFAGLGALVSLLGVGLMIYSLFFPKDAARPYSEPQKTLAPPPQYISPRPASSVTDHTTELLESNEASHRRRNTAPQSEWSKGE